MNLVYTTRHSIHPNVPNTPHYTILTWHMQFTAASDTDREIVAECQGEEYFCRRRVKDLELCKQLEDFLQDKYNAGEVDAAFSVLEEEQVLPDTCLEELHKIRTDPSNGINWVTELDHMRNALCNGRYDMCNNLAENWPDFFKMWWNPETFHMNAVGYLEVFCTTHKHEWEPYAVAYKLAHDTGIKKWASNFHVTPMPAPRHKIHFDRVFNLPIQALVKDMMTKDEATKILLHCDGAESKENE